MARRWDDAAAGGLGSAVLSWLIEKLTWRAASGSVIARVSERKTRAWIEITITVVTLSFCGICAGVVSVRIVFHN